jgi:hypothetical protein
MVKWHSIVIHVSLLDNLNKFDTNIYIWKLYVGLIIREHSMNGCVGNVYGLRGKGNK